jgi:ABC-type glycerol-3-phosphate transport system substrate-binding protein
MRRFAIMAALAGALALTISACGSSAGGGRSITVWDYYGSATPIKPAVEEFRKLYPQIHVNYQAIDYETIQDKFSVAVSSGSAPDVATLDMTWIPTYAAKGLLANVSALSGGELNGAPIADQYSKGALEAMKYKGKYVTMLSDFDAYALYYRADVFKKKGIAVPKTWAQLRTAAKKLVEDDSSGKPEKYAFQVLPDTFHFDQFLLQNKGSLLNPSWTEATLDSPAGEGALSYFKGFLENGSGIFWGKDQGDSSGIAGIKDERIGMFLNGPYMMGVMKEGAPEQAGKWRVAPAPVGLQAGTYLGGTGLTIPVNAHDPKDAWTFVQFLLKKRQQLGVYTYGGAAPATEAALASAELNKPNPYFGGEAPFPVFRQALRDATPFPYVRSWTEIDKAVEDAVTSSLLGEQSVGKALSSAAKRIDELLKQGSE